MTLMERAIAAVPTAALVARAAFAALTLKEAEGETQESLLHLNGLLRSVSLLDCCIWGAYESIT